MGGLSEAELHVQAMRLVCEALREREQDGLEVDWDVIRQMHDQMDAMLQALQHKHRCDSSEIVDLRKDRDHWKQARQDAHEAGELMRAEIETLRKRLADAEHPPAMAQQRDEIVYYLQARLDEERSVIAGLRQQLAEQQAETVDVRRQRNNETDRLNATNVVSVQQRDEIAYLRARVDEERSIIAGLRQQLDAALASLTRERLDAEERGREIERLRAFVEKVRAARDEHNGLARDAIVEAALAELDAGTEPAPVAEPLDAEGGECPGK